ncbi:MAG: hypothetical protein LBV43_08970 [Prevotella sp.]|nr:hypothetical protein [Prevotella sp.]
MKKHVCSFISLLVFIGFMSCSSSKSIPASQIDIRGSWRKVEENGKPSNGNHLKHYTDKNFVWHIMSNNNIIEQSAAGEYQIDNDELLEFINMTMINNNSLLGRTAKIKIKLENDTLSQNTTIPMSYGYLKVTEKWVKIK